MTLTARTSRRAERHGRRHARAERLRHPDAATSPSDLVMRPFLGERGFIHR